MARQTRQFPQGKYVLRTPHVTQDGQVYAVYMQRRHVTPVFN